MDEAKVLLVDIKSFIAGRRNRSQGGEIISYLDTLDNSLKTNDFESILYCLSSIKRIDDLQYSHFENAQDPLYILCTELISRIDTVVDNNYIIKKEIDKLTRFWTAFNEWFNDEKESISAIFRDSFVFGHYESDDMENRTFIPTRIKIDFNKEYRREYGINYESFDDTEINFDAIKLHIELIYLRIVKLGGEGRYPFAVKVNELFARFSLPYSLKSGHVRINKYKSSELENLIVNYEQFERKIEYSEQMIVRNDLMEKHTALNYIADAFCYIYSLFVVKGSGDDKILKQIGLRFGSENSKQYKMIKDEVEIIKRIINNYFDIRHNEYYAETENHRQERREPIEDDRMIEYLYNRIYAITMILKIGYKKPK